MKNFAKKTVVSTKKFVRNHKTATAFLAGAVIGITINRKAVGEHDSFLKEHGLYEAFYTPEG